MPAKPSTKPASTPRPKARAAPAQTPRHETKTPAPAPDDPRAAFLRRRAAHLTPGILAAAAAAFLGTAAWAVLLAILLDLMAFMPRRRDALVALLGAPVVLALGGPLHSLLDPTLLAWLVVLFGALAPLWLVLGGRIPWRPVPFVTAAALLLAVAVVLVRWTPTFTSSDIGTRAQVVLLAAATLLVASLASSIGRDAPADDPKRPRPDA